MRASLIFAACLLAVVMASQTSEDSWSESTSNVQASPKAGGRDKGYQIDVSGKKFAFLKDELNLIRGECGRTPITEFKVTSGSKQIVAGTLYKFHVEATDTDGTIKKVVTMKRDLPGKEHPSTDPKDGDSPARKGDTPLADMFTIISVEPHPCAKHLEEGKMAQYTDETDEELSQKYFTGLVMPDENEMNYVDTELTAEQKDSIPASWDWREHTPSQPPKAAQVLNQGSCGSCWAFGAATTMAYRVDIASKGKYNAIPSPQVGMSCAKGSAACNGGWFNNFYDAMRDNNVPGHWAVTYTQKPGPCSVSSDSIAYKAINAPGSSRSQKAVRGVDAMMYEVYKNGPAGMAINAGASAFQRYKSGVATGSTTGQISHAVTIVGWGTQSGVPYWLLQNSWGAGWGDKGMIKIQRGNNFLAAEAPGAQAGYSPTSMECASSAACENGGAFESDCSCHCLDGYSGPTCSSCQKNCQGTQFTGAAGIVNGGCHCTCAAGYVTPSNLLGYEDCALHFTFGGKSGSKVAVGTGAVAVAFNPAGKAPSDPIQNVKKGDMLVAVTAGEKPWTAAGGWNTDISTLVCGAKTWDPAVPCTQSTGSLNIATAGVYDVFYVKYNGVSEFGVDKGYGSDFMAIGTRLCVGGADCDSAPPPPPPAPPAPLPPPPPAPAPDKLRNCASLKAQHGCAGCCFDDGQSVVDKCPTTCAAPAPTPAPTPPATRRRRTPAPTPPPTPPPTNYRRRRTPAPTPPPTPPPTPDAAGCTDELGDTCSGWSSYCKYSSIKNMCKKTCNACNLLIDEIPRDANLDPIGEQLILEHERRKNLPKMFLVDQASDNWRE